MALSPDLQSERYSLAKHTIPHGGFEPPSGTQYDLLHPAFARRIQSLTLVCMTGRRPRPRRSFDLAGTCCRWLPYVVPDPGMISGPFEQPPCICSLTSFSAFVSFAIQHSIFDLTYCSVVRDAYRYARIFAVSDDARLSE
jgi:hypothetical protein